ncbi:MAG: type ISP restriction/modification enzyme [Pyrinomonadaceae bacterium]
MNLSQRVVVYLKTIGRIEEDAENLFYHLVALLHAPQYALENSGALRQDWPRIPLPSSKETLLDSAELGRKVAALLDTERGVAGVTEGKIERPLDTIGVISRLGGGQLQTEDEEGKDKLSELRITVGWGHGGKGGITMPGKGKLIERDYTPEERKVIEGSSERLGLSTEGILAHLGEITFDVYLNDVAYWKNIPARVWVYTIGGYQVIKKWLSYREHKLLGRALTPDEAREVMNIARRIASILLLEPSLDANYQAIRSATYPWPFD